MAAKRKVDYEAIEPGWRAGLLSPEQLAQEYTKQTGVTVTRMAIIKHFGRIGVARDLGAKIRSKADAMVSASMVSVKVSDSDKRSKETTEKGIIDAVASTQASIRTEQMAKASDNRKVLEQMIGELKCQNEYTEDLAKLGELMLNSEVKFDKLNEIYQKIIAFPGRVDSAKKLMESWVKVVELERKVYKIDGNDGEEKKGWTITLSKEDAGL